MKTNHVHKLKRHTYKTGSRIYQCVLDCGFKVSCELALGRRTICWRCGKEFSMNQYSLQLAKPHCEDCHVFKHENKSQQEITKTTETVMASVADTSIDDMQKRLKAITIKEYSPPTEEDEDLL